MIISEQMRILGTIEGSEDLVVRGRVEGAVRIRGALTVEEGAWLIAEVEARQARILGTVRGNVTARESIELGRTARMIGDAIAPQVTVAAGASFRGKMGIGDLRDDAVLAEPPAFAPTDSMAAPAPSARVIPPLARPRGPLRRRGES